MSDKEFLDCGGIPLNETYRQEETPKGFRKGFELYPHQKVILAAMLDVEQKREFKHHSNTHKTSAGLLSEKFGSGKTVIILALILRDPMPYNSSIYQKVNVNNSNMGITIEKTFDPKLTIRPAIVFVASSVILQWEKSIKRMTKLNAFIVKNVRKLNILWDMHNNGTINDLDVIIVKNGNITGKLNYDGVLSDKNNRVQKKIYNLFADMFSPYCFSRLIIDDYDIIGLPNPAGYINARFTWFVSATEYTPKNYYNEPNLDLHNDIYKSLSRSNLSLRSISKNNSLYNHFNVYCDSKFVEGSINLGRPIILEHRLPNRNLQCISMIRDLLIGEEYVGDVMEMLYSDAIETAAERAGIKSSRVSDIFKKILQDKYDDYEKATKTLAFIDTIDIKNLPEPPEGDHYHQKHLYTLKPIEYNYPNILSKIATVREECINLKKKTESAINRVKKNINEGDCPICYSEFKNTIIMNCCNKIICGICVRRGSRFRITNDAVLGRCVYCRTEFNFNELIFIDEKIDLEDINETNFVEEIKETKEEIPKEIIPEEELNDLKDITNPKCRRIMQIIKNYPFRDYKPKVVDINIEKMIRGNKKLPKAKPDERKFVIFANYDRSLDNVETMFIKKNINYKRLNGSCENIDNLVEEFRNIDGKNKILLINGEEYASGINLPEMTDLIIVHNISNKHKQAQIIGRGQRIGRKKQLIIHPLLYYGE